MEGEVGISVCFFGVVGSAWVQEARKWLFQAKGGHIVVGSSNWVDVAVVESPEDSVLDLVRKDLRRRTLVYDPKPSSENKTRVVTAGFNPRLYMRRAREPFQLLEDIELAYERIQADLKRL